MSDWVVKSQYGLLEIHSWSEKELLYYNKINDDDDDDDMVMMNTLVN